MKKTIGNFEIDVWIECSPVWIHIRHGGNEFKFTHDELPDFEYALKEAKRASYKYLSENKWSEIDQ